MSSPPRDKNATWQSLGTVCRQRGWSKPRAVYELQNGLRHRIVPPEAVPPGFVIDWHNPTVQDSLDVAASTVRLTEVLPPGSGGVGTYFLSLGIEVLPPPDAVPERKPKPKRKPKRKSAKKVSLATLERCFRDIMAERPDDPPDEAWLVSELKTRLGASPGLRDRVRELWPRIAPQWKRPVGAPRKKISAKNSAE